MAAELYFFDLDRGTCALIKTPAGRAILLDCGTSSGFSPARYIHDILVPAIVPTEGHIISHLILTHPHNDQIADLPYVTAHLDPYALTYVPGVPVEEMSRKDPLPLHHFYQQWITHHASPPPLEEPGLSIECFHLPFAEASKRLNDASVVTLVRIPGPKCDLRILLPAEVEPSGWRQLLRWPGMRERLRNVTVLVASYRGRRAGYSEELLEAIGEPPQLIVVAGNEDVDPRYLQGRTAITQLNARTTPWMATVLMRDTGHWRLRIDDHGTYACEPLPD